MAYVMNHASNTVSVIDVATHTVTQTLAGFPGAQSFGRFVGGPAAVVAAAGVQSVPTLSQWAVILLSVLLACLGVRRLQALAKPRGSSAVKH